MASDQDNDGIEATFTAYLGRRGKRVTKPRLRIVATLNDSPGTFSAADLIQRASEHAGRGTTYRTLMELVEARLVDVSGDQYAKRGLG